MPVAKLLRKASLSLRPHFDSLLRIVKAENENPTTAVYANVTEVKRTTPRAPTTSSISSSSSSSSSALQRPLLTVEGWEMHTDKDTGKAFFYQPSTGQSRWEDPRSPGMDSLASPLSATSSTSSSRGSDWEQILDEASGRHYYYNPSSGQTSWAAPGTASPLSPTTPPADSHSLLMQTSDGPPPLPEEDYPTDDHAEPQTPPVFSRDVPFPPVKRTPIPRPTLEPSVPAGWARTHQQDGKTVFTNERTQEQWIQSKDDKGKTYYYLKDGSKSQWNLPELSAPPTQPAVGNGVGVDPEGPPVLKNWRQSMVPAHLPVPAEDTMLPEVTQLTGPHKTALRASQDCAQGLTRLRSGPHKTALRASRDCAQGLTRLRSGPHKTALRASRDCAQGLTRLRSGPHETALRASGPEETALRASRDCAQGLRTLRDCAQGLARLRSGPQNLARLRSGPRETALRASRDCAQGLRTLRDCAQGLTRLRSGPHETALRASRDCAQGLRTLRDCAQGLRAS
ncbi:hypothetical protein ACEWY4_002316 [Coilia grayii]|uniref:WW domain-containing protein n=1 Tax=Coilia grayii TaxID=363190 RepID=A0ABD1KN04_9TELE